MINLVSVPMTLTPRMIEAARETYAGKLLDRLIQEENARGGYTHIGRGSVIEQLWAAMLMAGVVEQ